MTDLRYPIGKFVSNGSLSVSERANCIKIIVETPAKFRAIAASLSEQQLDTPYREGGWTARQVIHHVPDSHVQAYIRTKLALTEDVPTIKPYKENLWAALGDTATTRIELSLTMLELIHERWLNLLRSLKLDDFVREFFHPERKANCTIDWLLALYAWHGPHHIAHLEMVKAK